MRLVFVALLPLLASSHASADPCSKAEAADLAFVKLFDAIASDAASAGMRCLYHGPDDVVVKNIQKRLGSVGAMKLPDTPAACIKNATGLIEYVTDLGTSAALRLKHMYLSCSTDVQKRITDARKTGKTEADILTDLQEVAAAWVQAGLSPKK